MDHASIAWDLPASSIAQKHSLSGWCTDKVLKGDGLQTPGQWNVMLPIQIKSTKQRNASTLFGV